MRNVDRECLYELYRRLILPRVMSLGKYLTRAWVVDFLEPSLPRLSVGLQICPLVLPHLQMLLGVIAAVDPTSTDPPRQVAFQACSVGGTVDGSGLT
jgi:hypothetical protein